MSTAATGENGFINPILPGGYPDPSICRVGGDYYLVNSSFEYFPGLPLHHSRDLVNWELVGYGLHREEQCTGAVNLTDIQTRGGIHAPTLRFHNGTFYIITTNVYLPPGENQIAHCANFILTAQKIAGPWSNPHVLEDAPGIDPDIFFDPDGRVWYTGTHSPDNPSFPGEGEIWLQELDLETWQLTGERHFLWRGACSGVWAEGPHLYKKDGRYYLMIAEGGTSFNHAVMVAVSDRITGPYLSNPRNPLLTSRHLSYDNWVHSTGHADLVELLDGRWYMVALGVRGDEQRGSNMGRETHLIPVVWEREPFKWQDVKYEWPVCAPRTGRVERLNALPFADRPQVRAMGFVDDFDAPALGLEWNFRRVPRPGSWSLSARTGSLRLFARQETIQERGRYSFLGFRQRESDFEVEASMEFRTENEGGEAGFVLLQQDDNYLGFTLLRQGGQFLLRLELAESGQSPRVLQQVVLAEYKDRITFRVVSENHRYHFGYWLETPECTTSFAETDANLLLSRGYTGAYLGLYATGNGRETGDFADFKRVRYTGVDGH